MGLHRPLATRMRLLGLGLAVAAAATIGSYRSVVAESPPAPKVVSDFTLKDVEGKSVQLSSLKGKAYILDVWATWCPPCREEIPHLIDLQHKYAGQGLRIVGIALDDEGAKVVRPFVAQNHMDYTVLIGDESVEKTLGSIQAIPTTFFIDGRRHVHKVMVGYHSPAEFEKEVQDILGGEGSMMNCEECLEQLHDYLSHELTSDSLQHIEAHLQACPPCLDRFEFSSQLRELLHKKAADEPVPPDLQSRIRTGIEKELHKVVPIDKNKVRALPMSRGQSILGLVASLVVAISISAGLILVRGGGGGDTHQVAQTSPMLSDLVEDHVNCTSMVGDEQVSPAEAQHRLTDQLGYNVRMPHLPANCKTVSVRVCNIEGVPVGHLIVRREGHVFSWFVLNTHKLPAEDQALASDTDPRTVDSETLLLSVHPDQTDCIVSDQPHAAVKELALATSF